MLLWQLVSNRRSYYKAEKVIFQKLALHNDNKACNNLHYSKLPLLRPRNIKTFPPLRTLCATLCSVCIPVCTPVVTLIRAIFETVQKCLVDPLLHSFKRLPKCFKNHFWAVVFAFYTGFYCTS